MLEFKMDRKVFYGLVTVLGVLLALGLGLLIGRMMGGGDAEVANPGNTAPAGDVASIPPSAGDAGANSIVIDPNNPQGAVDAITGGQAGAAAGQPEPSIDYASYGIAADGELTPEQDATVSRTTIADVLPKLGSDDVLIVDVRSDLEFGEQHVQGAVNVPAYVSDDKLAELPKDKEILVYCA